MIMPIAQWPFNQHNHWASHLFCFCSSFKIISGDAGASWKAGVPPGGQLWPVWSCRGHPPPLPWPSPQTSPQPPLFQRQLGNPQWDLPETGIVRSPTYQSPIFLLNTFATEINHLKNYNLVEKSPWRGKSLLYLWVEFWSDCYHSLKR